MLKLQQLLSNLRSSFWFIPALIVAISASLAIFLIEADGVGSDRWLVKWPRLFGAGAEGSRQMLATLAGSMLSVLGVTFSMTLVALALASSQYTSRILRNFMRSQITQVTLGIFAGIFTYCLIVLRTIRSEIGEEFVPSLAVFFGFVLALGSIGVLIYFIHHIATSIQASSIIAEVTRETNTAIDRLFTEIIGQDSADDEDEDRQLRLLEKQNWRPMLAEKSGYIQSVNGEALLQLAINRQTLLRMERGIGDFVVQDTALASLAKETPLDPETIAALNAAYSVNSYRTVDQDPAFGISQIVDMALKALSPGVNDTSTAVMCIDFLTEIMARLATRQFPPLHRYADGALRVIAIAPTFETLLGDSFDQIRRNAAGNVAIMARLLSALETIASLTVSPLRLQALREQVEWIVELASHSVESTHDRTWIATRVAGVLETLAVDPGCQENEQLNCGKNIGSNHGE